MKKTWLLLAGSLLLTACQDSESENTAAAPVVRGLKTVLVEDQERTTVRRFPSVLQPAEVTTVSFEIAGKMGAMDLKVGQIVKKGDVLASVDPRSLEIQVESAEAAVTQAQASATNAAASLERLTTLLEKKVTTRAKVDDAQAQATASAAALAQAVKQLENAKENLLKTNLTSPIDGIVNSVTVEPFSNVSPGAPVATLYRTDGFEISFSVSYEVIQQLAVGKRVSVRLADNPTIVLAGAVTELGSRADTVSSFPLVISLSEGNPALKAGMAVEVSIEFPVANGSGFLLPLTILPLVGQIDENAGPNTPANTTVYVYDEASQTVKKTDVTIGGVRENQIIIVDGLKPGDRVASAGVSFLRDGQKVKLLPDEK